MTIISTAVSAQTTAMLTNIITESDSAQKTVDATDVAAPILDLPIEVLACIAQYLVLADDFHDVLHLSLTCRTLYRDLWSPSSDIWPFVWSVLYGGDSTPEQTLKVSEEEDETEGKIGSHGHDHGPGRVKSCCYRTAIQVRVEVLRDVRRSSQFLLDPDLGVYERALASDYMNVDILRLLEIGTSYDQKSLYWIERATNSQFWALTVSLWFKIPLRPRSAFYSPDTLRRIFDIVARLAVKDPCVLQAFYHDQYGSFRRLRRALFCQEMPSPQWQSRVESAPHTWFPWSIVQVFFMVLFCGPTVCSIETQTQKMRSNSIQDILDEFDSGILDNEDEHPGISAINFIDPVVPSWFNMGHSADIITPIPLIPLPSHGKQTRSGSRLADNIVRHSDMLTGKWVGYYSYREFDPDEVESDSDEENENDDDDELMRATLNQPPRDLEHAVRGLRLDRRMEIELVSWTTGSKARGEGDEHSPGRDRSGGTSRSSDSKDDSPLYLSDMTDLQAMQEVDRCFLMAKACWTVADSISGSNVQSMKEGMFEVQDVRMVCVDEEEEEVPQQLEEEEEEDECADCDDLNKSKNWQHQRIFSGRGQDAIGVFGIRGIISERTGLVRLVKSYFYGPDHFLLPPPPPPPPPPQEPHLLPNGSETEQGEKDSPYLEFGPGPDQLKMDLNGDLIVWYYRGQMEKDGPGILGLWYDEDVSGPFWLFPVT
ncbi:hypothetical protein BGZ83_007160 [Gryganskiella cystojenkinii]|nr:hypothetical protein BGZ83_007160 [Gryganskiella cystojenkinii]